MSKFPLSMPEWPLVTHLKSHGLRLKHRGKVRYTFELPGFPDYLLVLASDGLSIFDVILKALVPLKGELLTAQTVHVLTTVLKDIPNHLITYGSGIDEYLPGELRGNQPLQRCGIVVRKLEMIPVECIVRFNLTGSGWKDYKAGLPISGHILPPGLYDGAELSEPIFTPSTKAEEGHDEPLDYRIVRENYGIELEKMTLAAAIAMRDDARKCGNRMADTKMEWDGSKTVL